jgi:hypothetical protein
MMKEELEDLAENRLRALENIKKNKMRAAKSYDKNVKVKEFSQGDLFGNLYCQSVPEIPCMASGHQPGKTPTKLVDVCQATRIF